MRRGWGRRDVGRVQVVAALAFVFMFNYPVMLDLRGRLVVVVGGGRVGARKAAGALAAGARVRGVSPAFCEAFEALTTRKGAGEDAGEAAVSTPVVTGVETKVGPQVERIVGRYSAGHLAGAALVFAATDSAGVNSQVVRDAKAAGIWVSRADAPQDQASETMDGAGDAALAGDFASAARLDVGDVIVTVTAASAALSRHIRDELSLRFDPGWSTMATAMRRLRPWLRGPAGLTPAGRQRIFRSLTSAQAFEALAGGEARLVAWLRGRHPELTDAPDP